MRLRNKRTGEVVEASKIGLVWNRHGMPADIGDYGSLAELNKEWEDTEGINAPSTPLIKDEKIRKAVRAWAEVNSIEKALYAERPDRSLCLLTDMGEDDYNIDFVGWIPTLKDGEEYTIDELCGEEEAPEPLEPTFVDLDERIKEKEGK